MSGSFEVKHRPAEIRLKKAEKSLEIDFNDIIHNKGQVKYFSRELKIVYLDFF